MSTDSTAGASDSGAGPGTGDPAPPVTGAAAGPTAGPGAAGPGQPSEEELRAAYEAELSRITSADLMLQAAVSLLNVGSYRLAPQPREGADVSGAGASPGPSGGDLEQARDAIDGARALLEILERSIPSELAPLRNALSQLQLAYARAVQEAGDGAGAGAAGAPEGGATPRSGDASGADAGGGPGAGETPSEERPRGPGPAESSGRLWVPGR